MTTMTTMISIYKSVDILEEKHIGEKELDLVNFFQIPDNLNECKNLIKLRVCNSNIQKFGKLPLSLEEVIINDCDNVEDFIEALKDCPNLKNITVFNSNYTIIPSWTRSKRIHFMNDKLQKTILTVMSGTYGFPVL